MRNILKFWPTAADYPPNRLFCLDALRGLDMLLLVVGERIFWAANEVFHFPACVTYQFDHPVWFGFTLWDMILPLFVFMSGAAVPFALPKRLDANGRPTVSYWKHVFGRVALLWVLGMLCQGFLAKLDKMWINPFSNTLQIIAVGYVVAAFVLTVPGRFGRVLRWLLPIALALGYGALMHFCGDYTPEGNFPQAVEHWIRVRIVPTGSDAAKNWGNTWFLTTMMFAAMTLCGMNATYILRGNGSKAVRALRLFALGAALLAFGWAISPWVPVAKHPYTLSFVSQAMGWSCLLLATAFVVNDIWMFRRGWGLVILYGQFALWAYVISEFFHPVLDAAVALLTQGFPHAFGTTAATLARPFVAAIIITACLLLRKAFGDLQKGCLNGKGKDR